MHLAADVSGIAQDLYSIAQDLYSNIKADVCWPSLSSIKNKCSQGSVFQQYCFTLRRMGMPICEAAVSISGMYECSDMALALNCRLATRVYSLWGIAVLFEQLKPAEACMVIGMNV